MLRDRGKNFCLTFRSQAFALSHCLGLGSPTVRKKQLPSLASLDDKVGGQILEQIRVLRSDTSKRSAEFRVERHAELNVIVLKEAAFCPRTWYKK